jgi:hypothetical protein
MSKFTDDFFAQLSVDLFFYNYFPPRAVTCVATFCNFVDSLARCACVCFYFSDRILHRFNVNFHSSQNSRNRFVAEYGDALRC